MTETMYTLRFYLKKIPSFIAISQQIKMTTMEKFNAQ